MQKGHNIQLRLCEKQSCEGLAGGRVVFFQSRALVTWNTISKVLTFFLGELTQNTIS